MEQTFVEKFAKILADQDFVSQADAESLIKDFKTKSKETLVYFLIDEGLVQKNQVLKALSRYFNLASFDASGYLFDHALVNSFPVDFLTSNGIIPLSLEQDILTVVASQPDQAGLEARIGEYSDAAVEFVVGIKRDIWDAIQEFSDESLTVSGQNRTDGIEEEEADESIVDEESL